MSSLDPVSRDVYADILAAFPALEQARQAERIADAVRDAAPAWLPQSSALQVELSKLYVKPQKHVRILFRFAAADAASGDSADAASGAATDATSGAATAASSDPVWAVGKVMHRDLVDKLRRKAAKGKARRNGDTIFLWDHGLELEPFTDDAALDSVSHLTDPGWAVRYFQDLVPRLPLPADAVLRNVDIDPFKYLPGKRIVLRYHLHCADDSLTLFAKHYDADQGRAAAEIQNSLSRALESSARTAAVPRVYHYDPQLQVTFQQAWKGQAIPKGDSERPRGLWQRLLQATRELHDVPVPRGTNMKLDARALLFKVRKDVADISALLPQTQSFLEQVQTSLTRTLERETPSRIGFLHGSLLPSQILLGEKKVAFLDFDGTAEGDPLVDLCELMTSFLFEDWRTGHDAGTILAHWRAHIADIEAIDEEPVSRALARAYTLTFLLNRTHQHLKKLRPFPESGLPGLLEVLGTFLPRD